MTWKPGTSVVLVTGNTEAGGSLEPLHELKIASELYFLIKKKIKQAKSQQKSPGKSKSNN